MAIHGDSVTLRKLKRKKYEIRNKIRFLKLKIKDLEKDLEKIMVVIK